MCYPVITTIRPGKYLFSIGDGVIQTVCLKSWWPCIRVSAIGDGAGRFVFEKLFLEVRLADDIEPFPEQKQEPDFVEMFVSWI